jgi:nicotinamide riboside transporter PnuC
MSKRRTARKTFVIPTLIGLLTAAGLFAALLGDGWWDALAWLGMGVAAVLGIRGLLAR